ncbi:uncharacterized protein PG998_006047 [Apiospora kogelbergensis]|uniref:uncharacterized protein n=1 Tax=Apiospora kogelbergensis TaxID=1337665 RepID=UPI0031314333
MPEVVQKLKAELKSGLSSSSAHSKFNSNEAQQTEATAASSSVGGSDFPPASNSGDDPLVTSQRSDRQTLRKAAESEAAGVGAGRTTIDGVTMTPPADGGVIRSEEARARDRTQSDRMTLRKAAAHDRGEDDGLGA